MDQNANDVITRAYAGPTNRFCKISGMPQMRWRLLDAFIRPPPSFIILIPSKFPPFAGSDRSYLSRLLDKYMPFIRREHAINVFINEFGNLSNLQDRYFEVRFGDPESEYSDYKVTELPEETKKEFEEWVEKGGVLCGFHLEPPVRRLKDWLRGQNIQDAAHPHYCIECRKYTTNLQPSFLDNRTPASCYLCMACVECGTCHDQYYDRCKDNKVARAALDSLYRENLD